VRSPEGEFLGLIAVVLDISERLCIEKELRESENFLQRVTEVTPGVLYVFDLEKQRSVFINRSVASVIGYSPEEIAAMGTEVLPILMHPDDLPRFAPSSMTSSTACAIVQANGIGSTATTPSSRATPWVPRVSSSA
jgi:PAS domain-containing protein